MLLLMVFVLLTITVGMVYGLSEHIHDLLHVTKCYGARIILCSVINYRY